MTFDVRDAYDGSARAWAVGPAAIYRRMAAPLVSDCPIPLAGASVLDFGAGSGATTDVLRGAGAVVTAVDLSYEMLAADRVARPPAVNADMLRLPFRSRTFDVAAGAFALSHVRAPAAALREVARTVRGGGAVMTIGFDGRWEFAAKQTIEDVMRTFGFRRPDWYETFKQDVEPLTASADRLMDAARSSGLVHVTVHEHTVDVGVRTAEGIVAWRLGTPACAQFMAGLDAERRDAVLDALHRAVGPDPAPLVPALLVLIGAVPVDR